MQSKNLIDVNAQIAILQDQVAVGKGSETAQVEITDLLQERSKLINQISAIEPTSVRGRF